MMSRLDRLEMAAAIQEADDVYTTKDGFGIVCVKGAFSRTFVLDEIRLPKRQPTAERRDFSAGPKDTLW